MSRAGCNPPKGAKISIRVSVRDLHDRLKQRGFSWPFVRSFVLPDWWQDEMADNETDLALAEAYIAKQLGFSAEALRQRGRRLGPPPMAEVRFKRYKNEIDDKVRASALVAWRAAQIVVRTLKADVPAFRGRRPAQEIRESILRRHEYANLDSMLEYCWESGIIVLQLAHTPPDGKRFDGLAAVVRGRPIIVLASRRDSAPWLAFYVAHELGHIMLGHVRSGGGALIDKSLASATGQDTDEREADKFALELLSSLAQPRIRDLKASATRLALIAAGSARNLGVDPGVFTLIYAKSNNRWGVAQNALKTLGLDSGGRAKVADRLPRYVDRDQLSESDEQFLGVLKQP